MAVFQIFQAPDTLNPILLNLGVDARRLIARDLRLRVDLVVLK
jgi:hypothetical protein